LHNFGALYVIIPKVFKPKKSKNNIKTILILTDFFKEVILEIPQKMGIDVMTSF